MYPQVRGSTQNEGNGLKYFLEIFCLQTHTLKINPIRQSWCNKDLIMFVVEIPHRLDIEWSCTTVELSAAYDMNLGMHVREILL